MGKHLTKAQQARKQQVTAVLVEPRPVPEGSWHPRAVRWWEQVMASDCISAWDEGGWATAERLLSLVHAYWSLFDEGEFAAAGALSDRVRLLSQPLYIHPADRVRAIRDGVLEPRSAEPPAEPQRGRGAVSKARLRAVEAG